jgi:HEAT repeat protein
MGLFDRKPDTAALYRKVDLDGLTQALGHKDAKVREKAGWALQKLFSEATTEQISVMGRQLVTNDQLIPRMIAACSDEDETVRWCAVQSLGFWGAADPKDSRVLQALKAGLGDSDYQVREAAVRFLGMRKEPEVIESLELARVVETVPRVREPMAEALERHKED